MKIAVGSDHGGFELKAKIIEHLRSTEHQLEDLGAFDSTSVDYPDFGAAVGRAVASGTADAGIAICGSGIGIAIAANKIAGVRAATVHDVTSARLCKEHNDANVLCLGERFLGIQVALDSVDAYLSATFAGGRHARRVEKINHLDSE